MRLTVPPAPTQAPALQARLAALGFSSYRDYLGSSLWSSVKARYRSSAAPQECICGATTVHLHHRTYERLGEERTEDLYPLCPACHAMLHVYIRRGIIPADAHPETFRGPDAAERYTHALADVRDLAARELASPRPLSLLDRATVRQLHRRAGALRRLRLRQLRGPSALIPPGSRDGDHASAADLRHRTFDPT